MLLNSYYTLLMFITTYAWVVQLKDKEESQVLNALQKIKDYSKC